MKYSHSLIKKSWWVRATCCRNVSCVDCYKLESDINVVQFDTY
jgi:hypothetical protein